MVFKGRVPFGKGGTISPPPFTVESSHLPTDRCLSQQGKVRDRGEGGIAVPLTLTPAGATIAVTPWGRGKPPVPTPPFQGANSTPSGYPSRIPDSIVQGPLLVMVIPPHLPIPVNGLQHMGNPLLLGGVYRNCFLNSLDMQHLPLIPSFNLPKNLVNHIHFPCNNLCKSLQEGSLRPLEQLQGILGQFICLLKIFPLLFRGQPTHRVGGAIPPEGVPALP
uniref:Uncharacterized protein n=1 Tax=Botryococcus braunii Showa TaxID=1202541 RepID=A0A162NQW0_BOTBR|nr:hypothetical protein [Botryococcus braunii Showa]